MPRAGGIEGEIALFHDPIVEEVRAIREQLAAQFNYDIRNIVEDAQKRQATSKSRIVSFQQPAKAPPTVPDNHTSENISSQQTGPTQPTAGNM